MDDSFFTDELLLSDYQDFKVKSGVGKSAQWIPKDGAIYRKGPTQGGGGNDLLLNRQEFDPPYSVIANIEPLKTTQDAGSLHGIVGGYYSSGGRKRFYALMMEGMGDGSLVLKYYDGSKFVTDQPELRIPILPPGKTLEVKHRLRLEFVEGAVRAYLDKNVVAVLERDLDEPLGPTQAGFIASSGETTFYSLKVTRRQHK